MHNHLQLQEKLFQKIKAILQVLVNMKLKIRKSKNLLEHLLLVIQTNMLLLIKRLMKDQALVTMMYLIRIKGLVIHFILKEKKK